MDWYAFAETARLPVILLGIGLGVWLTTRQWGGKKPPK